MNRLGGTLPGWPAAAPLPRRGSGCCPGAAVQGAQWCPQGVTWPARCPPLGTAGGGMLPLGSQNSVLEIGNGKPNTNVLSPCSSETSKE